MSQGALGMISLVNGLKIIDVIGIMDEVKQTVNIVVSPAIFIDASILVDGINPLLPLR
tara:strand:+ start:301 stop:474 length:174 start_codon:yes stop_codon:yes gene_type:complete